MQTQAGAHDTQAQKVARDQAVDDASRRDLCSGVLPLWMLH